jgi:hypothetical protein
MKVLKSLCVLSLALFPLAPAGIEGLRQAAQSEALCASGFEQNLCGRCGDGFCSKSCGETAKTCPQDCGGGAEW